MDNLILFLDGKKAVIISIASAVLSYFVATNVLTPDLGALLQTIISLLAGGAVAITNSAVKNETNLGMRISNKRLK